MALYHVGNPLTSYPDTWEILRVRQGYHERYEVIDRRGRIIGVPHHTRESAQRYIDNAREKESA